jgi:predicted amidohydrolase
MGTSALQTVSESECIPHEGDSDKVNGGGSIQRLCEIAVENKVWLSVGGFPERRTVDEVACMSNTHVVICPEGLVMSPAYRKIHLFDSPLAGLHESKHTVAGSELVTANVSGFQVGLAICYDLRFPAFFEALCRPLLVNGSVVDVNRSDIEGAELVLVPSAFTQVTGKAHWEVLLRARAIENQCYIVAAAQSGDFDCSHVDRLICCVDKIALLSGQHNEKRASHGHTMIIDPWGTIGCDLFQLVYIIE